MARTASVLALGTLLVLLALPRPAQGASAAARVDLSGIPDRVALPAAAGTNLVIAASVPGEVTGDVWLSPDGPQEVRLILQEAEDGRYPVNLGDPIVEAVLTAMPRPGAFRIFAETDGGIAASMAVRYSVAPAERRPAALPAEPAGTFKLFAVSGGERREIAAHLAALSDLFEGFAATMPSSGLWDFPYLSPLSAPALRPEDVDALEFEYRTPSGTAAAHAQVGKRNWALVADSDEPRLRLELDDALRAAWLEAGELTIYAGPEGQTREFGVLGVAPESLDLPPEGAQLTVHQRLSRPVPGSEGFVRLRLGDITAGQVLVTLTAGEAKLIDARSMREGEEAQFSLGSNDYVLRLTRMVNVLVGDDFATFVVSRPGESDMGAIHGLIRQVEKADLIFIRNGKEYGPHAAAEHLRRKLDFASGEVGSLEDFIANVASRSWTTGEPYMVKLPDDTEMPFGDWLQDRAAERSEADTP
jgi:hypothetical protein